MRRLVVFGPLAGVAAVALAAGRRRRGAEMPAPLAQPESPSAPKRRPPSRFVTRRELYEQAKRLDIHGRSRMNKEELMTAVAEREGEVIAA